MLLVPLSAETCPDCSSELTHVLTDQPALFAADGQGNTDQTLIISCTQCTYRVHRDTPTQAA